MRQPQIVNKMADAPAVISAFHEEISKRVGYLKVSTGPRGERLCCVTATCVLCARAPGHLSPLSLPRAILRGRYSSVARPNCIWPELFRIPGCSVGETCPEREARSEGAGGHFISCMRLCFI